MINRWRGKALLWLWRHHRHLPDRIAHKIFKALNKAGCAPDFAFRHQFFGMHYDGNLTNNVDAAIYFYGAFEKPLLCFMGDALSAVSDGHGVFVDVGANVGQHSLYMSRFATQVLAFEPYEPVRLRLEHQLSLNAINNVAVHALGLSDANTKQIFFAPTGNNAGIGSFDPESTNKGNIAIGELALVRGDDFFGNQKPERLDLIKIDVEGFEKAVLHGLQQTLLRYRPLLIVEMTYGGTLSFKSSNEISSVLPPDYLLLCFDKRRADGRKRQRHNARARSSGLYQLIPYPGPLASGQDDVILCPQELYQQIPLTNCKKNNNKN
ncbi:FkbM family methyltransferase [Gammaproteobacteria bacterium LSUCC0112]|nr:FkbM family methyltransferase [Gammaproteobacteria bacterium LSUCC0112]